MSIKSGFFESIDHDRVYNSDDFSGIIASVINNGIFDYYKGQMNVELPQTKTTGLLQVVVKPGVAWFNGRMIYIDSDEVIDLETSPSYNQRWDAIVIDCDTREDTRDYTIKYIMGTVEREEIDRSTGTEIRSMFLPELIQEEDHFQIPLAYIYVYRNVDELTESDIVNMRGKEASDYILYQRNGHDYRLKTKTSTGEIIETPGCPIAKITETENTLYSSFEKNIKYVYFIYQIEPSEEEMKLLKLNTETDTMEMIDSDDPKYIDIHKETLFVVYEEVD